MNGEHIIGVTLKTGGGFSASSLSHGINDALSASAMALISSNTECAPLKVKNKPTGLPRNTVMCGTNGIVRVIFFGRQGPHVPCLPSSSEPVAKALYPIEFFSMPPASILVKEGARIGDLGVSRTIGSSLSPAAAPLSMLSLRTERISHTMTDPNECPINDHVPPLTRNVGWILWKVLYSSMICVVTQSRMADCVQRGK